jgi:hypothetical protein
MGFLIKASAVLTIVGFQLSGSPGMASGDTESFQSPSESVYVELQAKDTDTVVFNPRSLKYHIPSCSAAKRCTHCIPITRREAKNRGGVPCKLCGAGE